MERILYFLRETGFSCPNYQFVANIDDHFISPFIHLIWEQQNGRRQELNLLCIKQIIYDLTGNNCFGLIRALDWLPWPIKINWRGAHDLASDWSLAADVHLRSCSGKGRSPIISIHSNYNSSILKTLYSDDTLFIDLSMVTSPSMTLQGVCSRFISYMDDSTLIEHVKMNIRLEMVFFA